MPLITDSEGNKIGKSTAVDGITIWLSKEKTSPYDFYQYWINLPDADLQRFFLAFSFRSTSEIEEVLSCYYTKTFSFLRFLFQDFSGAFFGQGETPWSERDSCGID